MGGRDNGFLFFFSPSLSSLFVFPCLRSELESCDPEERIAGQRWESCLGLQGTGHGHCSPQRQPLLLSLTARNQRV